MENEDAQSTPPMPEGRRKSGSTCIPFTLFLQTLRPKDQSQWRFRKKAILAIQQRAEQHVGHLFREAARHAKIEGRITVQVRDFEHALQS